jgi:hypothetical protein
VSKLARSVSDIDGSSRPVDSIALVDIRISEASRRQNPSGQCSIDAAAPMMSRIAGSAASPKV